MCDFDTQVGDVLLRSLASRPNLCRASIQSESHTIPESFLFGMQRLLTTTRTLKYLKLGGPLLASICCSTKYDIVCEFTAQSRRGFIEALARNTSLTELDVIARGTVLPQQNTQVLFQR